MEFKDGLIKLDKVLNELDKFVLDFTNVLAKHTKYVIVSGYVAILFGRSRATEDIDILIPELPKETCVLLYKDLVDSGFWSYNTSDPGEFYTHLDEHLAVRISRKSDVIPNVELKFVKNKLDEISLAEKIKVEFADTQISISPLELQIPYKRQILASQKDLEDARHLEKVFEGRLNQGMLEKYTRLIKDE